MRNSKIWWKILEYGGRFEHFSKNLNMFVDDGCETDKDLLDVWLNNSKISWTLLSTKRQPCQLTFDHVFYKSQNLMFFS